MSMGSTLFALAAAFLVGAQPLLAATLAGPSASSLAPAQPHVPANIQVNPGPPPAAAIPAAAPPSGHPTGVAVAATPAATLPTGHPTGAAAPAAVQLQSSPQARAGLGRGAGVAGGPSAARVAAPAQPAVTSVWRPASAGGATAGGTLVGAPQNSWWLRLALHAPWLAQLLAGVSFAGIVKALCMAGNVLVQLSPYPQVRRWERRACTGEADAAPYVSIAFGGWQWCFYGAFAYLVTKRSGFLILVHSNCLGALLGTYYTAAFYRNCRHQQAVSSFNWYLSAVCAVVLVQVCALMALPAERALFFSGLISSFCSFVGAISMLVTVPAVLKTGDSRSIPGPMVVANFMSALVWCLCGWMLADPLVMGPNIVSALASLVCIYMKIQFPGDAMGDKEEKQLPSGMMTSLADSPMKHRHILAAGSRAGGSTAANQFADGTGGTF